jgi:hypothetical protein
MAYSDFTLESACQAFALDLNEELDLFSSVQAVRVSPLLSAVLDEFIPPGTSIQTEKARSEFIVAPEETIFIDRPENHVDQLEKILGVLLHCVGGDPATAGAAA